MAFDGIFVYNLKKEINHRLNGARVEKIYQPSKEEIVLSFRGNTRERLLICLRPACPRVHFIETVTENPATPPMFCMLLRKHLSGAKFLCVAEMDFERVMTVRFETHNEMGDTVEESLVIELIGNQANAVLMDQNGRIIDCLRRSDFETAKRVVQPGATYEYPERQSKISPLSSENDLLEKLFEAKKPLVKSLVATVDGMSPLVAREIAVLANVDSEFSSDEANQQQKKQILEAICRFKKFVNNPVPTMVEKSGEPFEFSYIDIAQYGSLAQTKQFENFSALLETFYEKRDKKDRIKGFSGGLFKRLETIKSRIERKILVRKMELEKCGDSEKLRIYGELIKANLYKIERGSSVARVENYYTENCDLIDIPLSVALSPAENATKYFKDYKKSCNALITLGGLIEQSENELDYICSVIDALNRAETVLELEEIKLELEQMGYLLKPKGKPKKLAVSKPFEFVSQEGFKILVGKNNRQNDWLTLKFAEKSDTWFHAKNIPGSHVIVFNGGAEISQKTIVYAAMLAAKHSSAENSQGVPIDYTPVKFVKKPSGAKPGMVIYTTNKTVYVTPSEIDLL